MRFRGSPGRAMAKITKVDVSADAAKSWALAALQSPVLAKALTRFRIPWRWNGGPRLAKPRDRRVGLCSADARPVARGTRNENYLPLQWHRPAGPSAKTER